MLMPVLSVCVSADIISTVEFNYSGELLATGDKGGRVVIFQREQEVGQNYAKRAFLMQYIGARFGTSGEHTSYQAIPDHTFTKQLNNKQNKINKSESGFICLHTEFGSGCLCVSLVQPYYKQIQHAIHRNITLKIYKLLD